MPRGLSPIFNGACNQPAAQTVAFTGWNGEDDSIAICQTRITSFDGRVRRSETTAPDPVESTASGCRVVLRSRWGAASCGWSARICCLIILDDAKESVIGEGVRYILSVRV